MTYVCLLISTVWNAVAMAPFSTSSRYLSLLTIFQLIKRRQWGVSFYNGVSIVLFCLKNQIPVNIFLLFIFWCKTTIEVESYQLRNYGSFFALPETFFEVITVCATGQNWYSALCCGHSCTLDVFRSFLYLSLPATCILWTYGFTFIFNVYAVAIYACMSSSEVRRYKVWLRNKAKSIFNWFVAVNSNKCRRGNI